MQGTPFDQYGARSGSPQLFMVTLLQEVGVTMYDISRPNLSQWVNEPGVKLNLYSYFYLAEPKVSFKWATI